MDLNKAKHQAKKVFNEGETGGALNNVNVILARLQKRVFDDLQIPLSEVLAVMIERGGGGHLKPLDPTPLPNPIWPNWNRNDYFAFHQQIVLKTNSCLMLKHEVQDLIDSPSHNLKKWASEKQERMNKGMCLRDLIHVKTFVESFSIVVSPIYRVYLSVSQCCVVESFPYFFVELCCF